MMRGYGPTILSGGDIIVNAPTERVQYPFNVTPGEVIYNYTTEGQNYNFYVSDQIGLSTPTLISLSADTQFIAGTQATSPYVRVLRWNGITYVTIATLDFDELPTGIDFSPDGTRLVVCSNTSLVGYEWDGTTFNRMPAFANIPTGMMDVTFAGIDQFAVLYTARPFIRVYQYNGTTYVPGATVASSGSVLLPTRIKFSQDGTMIGTVSSNATANGTSIFKLNNNSFSFSQRLNIANPTDLAFSPDNQNIAISTTSKQTFFTFILSGTQYVADTEPATLLSTSDCISWSGDRIVVGHRVGPFCSVYEYTNGVYNKLPATRGLNQSVTDVEYKSNVIAIASDVYSAMISEFENNFTKTPQDGYSPNMITYIAQRSGTNVLSYKIPTT